MFRRYRWFAPDTGANPTAGATPADANASTSAPGGQTTTSEPLAGDEQISLEEAKKLRSEAASLRKRMKAFEDAEAKAKDAQLTEQEKAQKQLADYQAQHSETLRQLQEERNSNALERAGRTLGIADPIALADAVNIALATALLEHDDAGKPTNADAIMKEIIKARPWLTVQQKPATSTAGGATNPGRATTNASQITADFVQKLTSGQLPPDTYEKLSQAQRNEVQRVQREISGRKW